MENTFDGMGQLASDNEPTIPATNLDQLIRLVGNDQNQLGNNDDMPVDFDGVVGED